MKLELTREWFEQNLSHEEVEVSARNPALVQADAVRDDESGLRGTLLPIPTSAGSPDRGAKHAAGN